MRLQPSEYWSAPGLEVFLLEPHLVTKEYVAWLNDPEVNRYLESRYTVHTLEGVRAYVEGKLADDSCLFLGIRSTVLDRHVGNIKLEPIERRHGRAEVGLAIGDPKARGQGLGTAAIAQVCIIAREQLGLRKLTAGCYASNVPSARAFLRAGFLDEGVRRAHFILDGKPEDLQLFGRVLTPEIE